MADRILYVDDEADIAEVAAMALELDPGFEVRTCASGEEAIVAASEWSPSLILLDVMMPLMDGPTTLTRLRSQPRTAYIPIVFITARTHASEIEHLKALGAIDVIAKPFDPMTLAARVRGYL